MSLFIQSSVYAGIEFSAQGLKIASLRKKGKAWEVAHLLEIGLDESVNPLDKLPKDIVLFTSLSTRDVLVKNLEVPLTKEKDIEATLDFQAEPLLPYPLEKCILQYLPLETHKGGTSLTLLSVKKDLLNLHLENCKKMRIDPDGTTSTPLALAAFSTLLPSLPDPFFIIHFNEKEGTCALIEKGKLLAARAVSKDINEIQKTVLSLASSYKNKKIDSIVLLSDTPSFGDKIQEMTDKTVIVPDSPFSSVSKERLHNFCLPIGIALVGAFEKTPNFRQKEFAYPRPWKKIKKPLLAYFSVVLLLCSSTYGLSHLFLHHQQTKVEQAFSALEAFEGKPSEKRLSKEEMMARLEKFEAEILSRPDTFPLLPSIPRLQDVLAWLTSHPQLTSSSDSLEIEQFHYVLEKRPDFSHKNEHYIVKIELELSNQNPQAARAFYEALKAPNPFVDPKKEIQWNPGKGKCGITFYLKDKTRYQ